MVQPVYINRISAFLPHEPVDNEQMEARLGLVGGKPSRARKLILRSNGIVQRHYVIDPQTGAPSMNNAQVSAAAIRGLLGGDFQLDDLDCLVASSASPDQVMPGHAVMVQGELGNPPCEVVSTAGICLCGMTALKYAWMSVASGESRNAVACGSEVASTLMQASNFNAEYESRLDELETHPEIAFEKDFLRWMLSDGAGAVLLQGQPNSAGLSLRIEWIDIFSFADRMPPCMYAGAERVEPGDNRVLLRDGRYVDYDYLVIATGPKLAFDEIPGLGPDGFTQSICHVSHAETAKLNWDRFTADPGPIVVGAVQGASCYGPAYEFAFIVAADLRKRKLRHKVPITFVTSEPYIGHLGLGGVGDSKSMLESELRSQDIKWIHNARTTRVEAGKMFVEQLDDKGQVADRQLSDKLFDADQDAWFNTAERIGDRFFFISFKGTITELDLSGPSARVLGSRPIAGSPQDAKGNWRPGGYQAFAVHPGGRGGSGFARRDALKFGQDVRPADITGMDQMIDALQRCQRLLLGRPAPAWARGLRCGPGSGAVLTAFW